MMGVDRKPSKEEDYLQSISFHFVFLFNFKCMKLIKKNKAHRICTQKRQCHTVRYLICFWWTLAVTGSEGKLFLSVASQLFSNQRQLSNQRCIYGWWWCTSQFPDINVNSLYTALNRDISRVWPSVAWKSLSPVFLLCSNTRLPHPSPLLPHPSPFDFPFCKYCIMHFDIIDMFWYFKSRL